jgi:hypothetical protein
VLTGGHIAIPCAECHKESAEFRPKPAAIYHWRNLSCASCHAEAAQIRRDDLRREQNAILINGEGGPYGKNAKHRLVPSVTLKKRARKKKLPAEKPKELSMACNWPSAPSRMSWIAFRLVGS